MCARKIGRSTLKILSDAIGSGRLSPSDRRTLMNSLGVAPGSVTPFALINDAERKVQPVLDAAMMRHELSELPPAGEPYDDHHEPRIDLRRFIESLRPRAAARRSGIRLRPVAECCRRSGQF